MSVHGVDAQEGPELAVESDLRAVGPGAGVVFHVMGGRDGHKAVERVLGIAISGHVGDGSGVEGLVDAVVCLGWKWSGKRRIG